MIVSVTKSYTAKYINVAKDNRDYFICDSENEILFYTFAVPNSILRRLNLFQMIWVK